MLGLGIGSFVETSEFKSAGAPANSNTHSILLDGTNDYLTQPDGDNVWDDLGSGSGSLSFYFKLVGGVAGTIMWKGTYPSDYIWFFSGTGGDLELRSVTGSSTTVLHRKWNTNFSADTWYHVVLTIDGSGTNKDIKMYVDKVEYTPTTTTIVASSTNFESHTGSTVNMVGSLANLVYYNLYIDQMATWSSALSAAEVTEIYDNNPLLTSNAGNYVSASNLSRYYKMDENTGTTAADSSGNSNADITLVNGPTWSTNVPWS